MEAALGKMAWLYDLMFTLAKQFFGQPIYGSTTTETLRLPIKSHSEAGFSSCGLPISDRHT